MLHSITGDGTGDSGKDMVKLTEVIGRDTGNIDTLFLGMETSKDFR